VVALTDAGGSVVDRYAYGVWGSVVSSSEAVPRRLRYAGYWYDAELGWYWAGVRYYSPSIKRWLQPDPSMQDGVRTYVYVGDDPIDFIDPSGLNGGTPSPTETPTPGTPVPFHCYAGTAHACSTSSRSNSNSQTRGIINYHAQIPCSQPGRLPPGFALAAAAPCVWWFPPAYGSIRTGGPSTPPSVDTPYGPAVQDESPEALAALRAARLGARLYRVGRFPSGEYPGSVAYGGQFWSLENPLTVPDFAENYGIGPQSGTMDWVESGTLKPGAPAISRITPPVGANPGGSLEIVTSPDGITLNDFTMLDVM